MISSKNVNIESGNIEFNFENGNIDNVAVFDVSYFSLSEW